MNTEKKQCPYFFFRLPGRVSLLWPCPVNGHTESSLYLMKLAFWLKMSLSMLYIDCAFSMNFKVLFNFLMWFTLKWCQQSIIFVLWLEDSEVGVSARPRVWSGESGVSIKLQIYKVHCIFYQIHLHPWLDSILPATFQGREHNRFTIYSFVF